MLGLSSMAVGWLLEQGFYFVLEFLGEDDPFDAVNDIAFLINDNCWPGRHRFERDERTQVHSDYRSGRDL